MDGSFKSPERDIIERSNQLDQRLSIVVCVFAVFALMTQIE